ncbi:MAG TPA: sensor domain-containing diguanylate cyclase [Candidatus Sulfotelmatobacter sp.]|jgi:diguanylate cyclase (GGDEF)-like protein/PAS domain S-box-containing protein|nr:sensor domain-containing diguanylate cyclase [Candidatus Sulfotelmatobacter sp.]
MRARRIALYYFAAAVLWILSTDALLPILPPDLALRFSMVKGLVFVTLTAVALYAALARWDSQRQHMEDDLRHSRADLAAVIDNLPDIFYRTDLEGRIVMMSRCGHRILGYEDDELIGKRLAELYTDPGGREKFLMALADHGGIVSRYEVEIRRKDGQTAWLSVNARHARDDQDRIVGVEGLARDITEHKFVQDKLLRLARFDPLTGLLNRQSFSERLNQALARARRGSGGVGILFLDLDGFKEINDGCGHDVGDMMLQEVGRRLSLDLRETDVAGRFGGDEFLLMLEGSRQDEGFMAAAERLVRSLRQPFDLCGAEHCISVSIGLAQFPDDGLTAEELMRHADQAMYLAKSGGKNAFRCFQPLENSYAHPHASDQPNASRFSR